MYEEKLNANSGQLGAKFGKLSGRPSYKGKPYGMSALEYNEISFR